MFTALYNRIESKAGGCFASDVAFIRAVHSMITPEARTRAHRDARHVTIRQALDKRDAAQDEYYRVARGQYYVALDNFVGGE